MFAASHFKRGVLWILDVWNKYCRRENIFRHFAILTLLFDLLMRFYKTLMGSDSCWCQQSFMRWLWLSIWSLFPARGLWWGSISITVRSQSAYSNHHLTVITQRMGLIFDPFLIYSKTHHFNVHTDTWRWTIYEGWWTPLPLSFNASLIF